MVTIVDPTTIQDWDNRIKPLPGAAFFHGAAWARVLKRSYGYGPLYFLDEEKRPSAVIPLMEVISFLTGKRAVSLPFTDYCEALSPHEEVLKVMFDAVIREGRQRGWKYIELRGGSGFLGERNSSAFYYRHTLDLTPGAGMLFNGFRDSVRRNIRKALKEGVEVRFEFSIDAVRQFYYLNCLTRREHGLPPQPWVFFAHLHDEIVSRGAGVVALGLFQNRLIAANVYLFSNGEAIYKYGASDRGYQHVRANNLLMWEAIRRFADDGCKQLCFGRTEPENEGLRRFKTGWGAGEQIVNYYRYHMASGAFMPTTRGISRGAARLFASVPLAVSRAIGAVLYRHVG